MNIPVSLELLAGILGGLIVSMVVLLLLQVRNSAMVSRIAAPAYEFVQQQAEREAETIIEAAKKQAADIVAAANAQHAEILASYTSHAAELQASYQEHLKNHTEMLTQKMNGAIAMHIEKLEGLGDQSIETLEEGRAKVQGRFSILLESFTRTEHDLEAAAKAESEKLGATFAKLGTEATAEVTTKVAAAVASVDEATKALVAKLAAEDAMVKAHLEEHTKAALAAVDSEIAALKASRLRILDTRITEIVEAVTKQVLQKQLTITEHAALAKEALAAAKRDGAL